MSVGERAAVAVPPRVLTAEEFSALPEDVLDRHELVRGRLEELDTVVPGVRHAHVMARIGHFLMQYVEPRNLGLVVVGDPGFILERSPDTVRGPDVAFVRADRVPPHDELDGFAELAPDLAVEVLSPSDRPGRVQAKVTDYLRTGVPLVWVVDPRAQTVTVHVPTDPPRILGADERLDGGDVLPGFACAVRAILA